MPTFTGTYLLSLCLLLLIAATGCQSKDESQSEPFSIIYGGDEDDKQSLFLSDAKGEQLIKIISATLHDGYPAVSPSGRTIAFYGKYDNYKTWSIHTVNVDGTNVRRLTKVKNVWDSSPTWSPDGKTIAFAREYKGTGGSHHEEIWLMNADGTNQRQIMPIKGRSPEFMPDGRLLFQTIRGPSQIGISNIDGSDTVLLTDDDSNNMSPKISPDGKQIAYLSNRDGNQEVYVMNLDGTSQVRLTKNHITEWDPAWSPDGEKVLFASQSVHGSYDIYRAHKGGSAIEFVLRGGGQAATVYHLDKNQLQRLLEKQVN